MLIPYGAIPMFDQRYHEKYVSLTLPQSLGLTVLADFPSMVFVLLTAYLLVRALDTNEPVDAMLAGLLGGFAIGLKPSNSLFFGAAILALLVARRWSQTAMFLASLVPGVLLLALWKQRGLGQLPAFSSTGRSGGGLASIGADVPIASLPGPIDKYVSLDWHHLHQNIDGVREFFWAVRPLEFIIFAGLIALGRRSWPKAILIFGWFMTFLLLKGTDVKANVEDASFFRLLMPSFPAFLLLLASIPLLVPTFSWTRKVFPKPLPVLPTRKAGRPLLAAAAAVLVLLPLIFIVGTSPQSTAEAVSYPFQDVFIPVQSSYHLRVVGKPGEQRLTWDAPYAGSDEGLLHDPPLEAGRARPVRRRPQDEGGRRVPRPPERRADQLPAVHEPPVQHRRAAVHRPPRQRPLDVPRRPDGELAERHLARRPAVGFDARHDHGQVTGRLTLTYRLAAAGAWLAFIWATTHWYSWQQTVDLLFGSDAPEYERVARAAPALHRHEPLPSQHADRFVPHYLVGLAPTPFHVGVPARVLRLAFVLLGDPGRASSTG